MSSSDGEYIEAYEDWPAAHGPPSDGADPGGSFVRARQRSRKGFTSAQIRMMSLRCSHGGIREKAADILVCISI